MDDKMFKTVVDVNLWIDLYKELRGMPASYHRDVLTAKVNRTARTENLRVMSEVAAGKWGQVVATQHVWDMLQTKLREPRFGASSQEVNYFLELFTQIILLTGGTISVRKHDVDLGEISNFMKLMHLPDIEDTLLVVSAFDIGATTILTHDNHLASCAYNLVDFNRTTPPTATKPEIVWRDCLSRQQRSSQGEFLRTRRTRFHQNSFGQILVDHRDRREFLAQPKSAQAAKIAEWKARPENIV